MARFPFTCQLPVSVFVFIINKKSDPPSHLTMNTHEVWFDDGTSSATHSHPAPCTTGISTWANFNGGTGSVQRSFKSDFSSVPAHVIVGK